MAMWWRSRRNLNGAEGAVHFPHHEIESGAEGAGEISTTNLVARIIDAWKRDCLIVRFAHY